jgi:mono/diheme cytochrome c family protein
MKKQFIFLMIAAFLISTYVFLQNSQTAANLQSSISYTKDIRPILESRCITCHTGRSANAKLDMATYQSLLAGSEYGPVILPGNAKDSLLAQKISKGEMPKRGPKLTPAQVQTLIDWINAGAPNN